MIGCLCVAVAVGVSSLVCLGLTLAGVPANAAFVAAMAAYVVLAHRIDLIRDRVEYRGRRLAALKHLRAVYGPGYRGDGMRCRGTTLCRGYQAEKRQRV